MVEIRYMASLYRNGSVNTVFRGSTPFAILEAEAAFGRLDADANSAEQ